MAALVHARGAEGDHFFALFEPAVHHGAQHRFAASRAVAFAVDDEDAAELALARVPQEQAKFVAGFVAPHVVQVTTFLDASAMASASGVKS